MARSVTQREREVHQPLGSTKLAGNPDGHGTGGGFSTLFPMPAWQANAPNGPGRAVAPLYAGLFAGFGRKLGFVTPTLWSNQTCFNDIVQGDNGYFRARPGPDPCTGLGSQIGARLAALFKVVQPAGASQRAAPDEADTS